VVLFRTSDGALLHLFRHTDPVNSLAFAPDGQTLASGSNDGKVQLWQVSDGTLLHTLEGNTDFIESLAFSPDGEILAVGSWNGTLQLWHAADGVLLRTLAGHTGRITSLAFSPDGQILASGSVDSTLRLWKMTDGSLLHTIEGSAFYSIVFSPDGWILASGSSNDTVQLWGVKSSEAPSGISLPSITPTLSLAGSSRIAATPMSNPAFQPTDVRVMVTGRLVEATFYLADLPAELMFQREGVEVDTLEYEWEVCVNTDGKESTGMNGGFRSGMLGIDYCLSALSYKENELPKVMPIEQGVQVDVWQLTATMGTHILCGSIHVDAAEHTITLSGEIPDITKESVFYYMTFDANPAGRSEKSTGILTDIVEIH